MANNNLKKDWKVGIIITSIIILVLVLGGIGIWQLLPITKHLNNEEFNVMSVEDFKSIMEENGYTLQDDTEYYKSDLGGDVFKAVVGAEDEEAGWFYYFFEISNEEEAKNIFEFTVNNAEEDEGTIVKNKKKVNLDHKQVFAMETNGIIITKIRVKNTILLFQTPKEKEKDLNKILKAIDHFE